MSSPKIDRRDFLKLSLGAGLAALVPSIVGGCAGPAGSQEVTLRMWMNHPEWKDQLLACLKVFEDKSNITVQLEPKPNAEYSHLLSAAMQAKQGPDVLGLIAGPSLDTFLESGYIINLAGKLKTDRLNDFVIPEITRNNGEIVFGIPDGKYTVGMYYHKQIFDELGLQVPRTWDAFRSACETIQKSGTTPLMMCAKDGIIPAFYYQLVTGSVLGTQGMVDLVQGKRKFTDPDIVEAAQFLVDLVPYMPEGFASVDYAEGKAMFARGECAIGLGGSADYTGYREVNKDVDVGFFAFPPKSAGQGVPSTVSGLDVVYCISSTCTHVDEAIQLLDWFSTQEAGELFAKIQLPVVKGVVPTDPMWALQVEEAKSDMPILLDMIEGAKTWDVLTQHMQAVLLGKMSVEELCAQAQEALIVKPA